MRFQTIQLFSHVHTLRHQHQLLFQTVVFQLNFRLFQFGDKTLTLPLQHFWHMSAHFSDFGAHAFKALLNHRFQRLAFGFAGNDKVVQRAVECSQDFSGNRVQILLSGGHHARPAQNINRVDLAFIALHFDPVRRINQLFCQLFVQDQFALGTGIGLKTQITFHFPAGQTRTDTLTHHGLQAAQLFRHTEICFQIALVYRAHFPGSATPATLDFTPGVGGHTADHRHSRF